MSRLRGAGSATSHSAALLDDERGDVPGWVLVPFHLCQNQSRLFGSVSVSASVQSSPPKAHLPGKGAPNPQHVEGGRPFESGRVREAHGTAGAVGVSASGRVRAWGCRAADHARDLYEDERADVPRGSLEKRGVVARRVYRCTYAQRHDNSGRVASRCSRRGFPSERRSFRSGVDRYN